MNFMNNTNARQSSIAVRAFDFQDHQIRCVGTDRDLWFVAKEVAEALGITWKGMETLAAIPKNWIGVRNLRTTMRQRDGALGFAFVDTIVINEAALYKLAFRSNKPAADAFTNWVASDVLPAIRKAGVYDAKRRQRYEQLGKAAEWVEERTEGIEHRKTLTATIQAHDANDYAGCTNAIYKPVLGGTAAGVRMRLHLKPKANLRDSLSTDDLARVKFAEMLATEKIEVDNLKGNAPCRSACQVAGNAVAVARQMVADAAIPRIGNS